MSAIRLLLKVCLTLFCVVAIFWLTTTVPSPVYNSCITAIPVVILTILVIGMAVNYLLVCRVLKRTDYKKLGTSTLDFTRFKLDIEGRLRKYNILYPVFLLISSLELLGYFFYQTSTFINVYATTEILGPSQDVFVFSLMSFYGICGVYVFVCLLFFFFWVVFGTWKVHIMRNIDKHYYLTMKKEYEPLKV